MRKKTPIGDSVDLNPFIGPALRILIKRNDTNIAALEWKMRTRADVLRRVIGGQRELTSAEAFQIERALNESSGTIAELANELRIEHAEKWQPVAAYKGVQH